MQTKMEMRIEIEKDGTTIKSVNMKLISNAGIYIIPSMAGI